MKTNENIQYLRGVAALTVVLAHISSSFSAYRHIGGIAGVVLHNMELIGQVGVGVFFVISGYIMSMTTNEKVGGVESARAFVVKRALRIYPLYFFWTTVSLVLWSMRLYNSAQHYSVSKMLTSYMLIPYISFAGDVIDPILRQGWTLMYEVFFYITFAALLLLGQHRKIGIIILTLLFILLGLSADFMPSANARSFFLFQIFYLFIVGMFIFHYQERILNLIRLRWARELLLAVFVVLTLIILLKYDTLGDNAVYLPYLAAILLFLYVFAAKKVSGAVLEIGNSSYSLYLTHMFSTTAYGMLVIRSGFSNLTLLAFGIGTFLMAVVIGEITYRVVEKRLISMTTAIAPVPIKLRKT